MKEKLRKFLTLAVHGSGEVLALVTLPQGETLVPVYVTGSQSPKQTPLQEPKL